MYKKIFSQFFISEILDFRLEQMNKIKAFVISAYC